MGSEDVKFRMLKVLNEMLEVYARLLELIINIEEEEKRPIEEVIKETFSIESLSALALKLPPEVLGKLFAFILRVSSLFTIYRDPLKLSLEDKKKCLRDLKEAMGMFKDLLDSLERFRTR
ncbi:MAG: hypothetical protein QXS05_04420 [Candidatus Bathyarchaeia archaeon]|nr:hypothetical protein [Candidatus Bathyarchaeota archaeon]